MDDKLKQLNLSESEIKTLKVLAESISKNGALSARQLEGIVIILKHEIASRIAGKIHDGKGTDEELFKAVMGEMIDTKYEHMPEDLIVRIASSAVAGFCRKYDVGFEYMVTPKK